MPTSPAACLMEPVRSTASKISLIPRPTAYRPPTSNQTLTRGTSEVGGLPGRPVFKTAMRTLPRKPSRRAFDRPPSPVRAAGGRDPSDRLVLDDPRAARYSGHELIVCTCD